MNFTEKNVDLEQARVVVLPLPYGESGTYRRGAENGPNAILCASQQLELYDDEIKSVPSDVGIFTLKPPILSPRPEEMIGEVYKIARGFIEKGRYVIAIGGDHTVTIGLAKAHKETYKHVDFLVLDAHSDLRDEYQGSRYSHACTCRRLSEFGMVRIAGVRSISNEELKYIKADSTKCEILYMNEIVRKEVDIRKITGGLSDDIYLSVDLDVLDSGIMPSVQTPEPGGFLWYDMLKVLKVIMREKNVVGFDLVELSPIPGNPAPDYLAAKLAYKMIGYKRL